MVQRAPSNAVFNDDIYSVPLTHVSTSHLILNNEMSVSTVDAFTYALGAQTTFRLDTVPHDGCEYDTSAVCLFTSLFVDNFVCAKRPSLN